MSLNEATKANLRRKSEFIDDVQLIDGMPLFSWIDLNITELCNRKCVFCPRIDDAVYPNQNLHMSQKLASKIADELKALDYRGAIVLSGFGESLLHPEHLEIIRTLRGAHRLEIVSSGDRLTVQSIQDLSAAGIDCFIVSMYDGPEQREKFTKLFAEAGLGTDAYILRDRWHNSEDEYGLKLTNRAGLVNVGNQPEVDVGSACYYPSYSMVIDWNGDVLLCVQDWNKRVKAGNVFADSMWDIWTSSTLSKYRKRLMNKDRSMSPCNKCNTDGKLHGQNHKDHWIAYEEAKRPKKEAG